MTYAWWQKLKAMFGQDHFGFADSWHRHRYVVVDLELTGLNPKEHEIVSMAWVVIENQRICPRQSAHMLHSGVSQLAQSPIYHGITASRLISEGDSMAAILTAFDAACEDSILVFHNALLDERFLRYAYKQQGQKFRYLTLDTLKIEQRRLARQGTEVALDALSLSACRRRYQLPVYREHNALSDALATAELFLAQVNHMSRQQRLPLSALITAG
ncbi:3'-5' exonuclease [Pseudoalteromonas ruthenica]|uniref:3'-5' exonuclease n=1 Tax=Pseudoalteromonas ruthenica TaxID=151081 RepID=UPI001108B3F5|nr:3'-5' exonuclease [Pseudoalteromonas ruthenica]TLX50754.1 3'-5' exonuclease [Pseudoalteromonas ruthenica]